LQLQLLRCEESRTTLYFSQRCETSCLRVTSPLQLATQFCQSWPIRAHLSLVGDFKMASAILFVIVRVASCKKSCKRVTPLPQLERFLFVIVALQVARKIASCYKAFSSAFDSTIGKFKTHRSRKTNYPFAYVTWPLQSLDFSAF